MTPGTAGFVMPTQLHEKQSIKGVKNDKKTTKQ